MNKPWEAERVVTPGEAAQLIEAQFPPLRPARVELLGQGWDNTVFLVNGAWVFRFPRREIAVELIRTESRALPKIASALPLPVPVPEWMGQSSGAFPWPFAGYRMLLGRTACTAHLTETQRAAAAKPLAQFLAALHGLEPHDMGAPVDTLERANMEKRLPALLERLGTIRKVGLVDDISPWQRWLEAHPPPGLTEGPLRLAHGDLYARHILVDEKGLPCGVIDWGDLHLGNPGVDLGMVFGFLPPSARDQFWNHYPMPDPPTLALARLRALFSAVAMVDYGHDMGDTNLVREGLIGMELVLQD